MYRRKMSEREFADALDDMAVTDRKVVGPVLVITGASPRYGEMVLVQSFGDWSAIYERPEGDEPEYESPEAVEAHRQMLARFLAEIAEQSSALAE